MYTLHLADGPQQRARDALMGREVRGERVVGSPNMWSDPTTQRWAYVCDPAEEVRVKWEERGGAACQEEAVRRETVRCEGAVGGGEGGPVIWSRL